MPPKRKQRPEQGAPQSVPNAGQGPDAGTVGDEQADINGITAADPQVVGKFLRMLFEPVADGEEGRFTVGQMPIWTPKPKRTRWCSTIVDAAAALSEVSSEGHDTYIHVALHDQEIALAEARKNAEARGKDPAKVQARWVRGCAASAVVLPGLWSDEDHAEGEHSKEGLPPDREAVLSYLRELPSELRPTLTIESGGGFYPWWLFKEPWVLETEEERARAASLVRRMQRYLHSHVAPQYAHDSTADLARVLRPPGVVNYKYRCLVRIVDLASGEPSDES